jgi:hypothetical protein
VKALPPVLDERGAPELRAELLARRPAYAPAWQPRSEGADAAVIAVAARYLEVLLQRLELAPEKNRLAFLSLLGIERIPAQPSRAALVFQLKPPDQAADVALPALSRAAAPPPPESSTQIVFETERAAGLAVARLLKVVTVWPGRDQYIDHSADFAAGRPLRPFARALLVDTPHQIYIAHDTLLKLTGRVELDLQVELIQPSNEPLDIQWEYFDGTVWRQFKNMRPGCEGSSARWDGTEGFTRSGRIRLEAECAETARTTVEGVEAFWIRGTLTEPLPLDPRQVLPIVDDLKLSVHVLRPLPFDFSILSVATLFTIGFHFPAVSFEPEEAAALAAPPAPEGGLLPDSAFAGAESLDVSKSFYPLGQAPRPGDAFYFASDEVLSKPGAEVTVRVRLASATPSSAMNFSTKTPMVPVTAWEYWNGRKWQVLVIKDSSTFAASGSPEQFTAAGSFGFIVPDDVAPTKVSDKDGLWVRMRLVDGSYGFTATATFNSDTFTYYIPQPPALSAFAIGYSWEYGPFPAEHVLTHNDFQYREVTEEARWPGRTFPPFTLVTGLTPALYLGFDRALPVDRLNFFFDVLEQPGETRGPELQWEFFDGIAWSPVSVEDETANLRVPGMVSIIGPEGAAAAPRFGASLFWLRGRLKEDGPPGAPELAGIHPNAVWASQQETISGERIGTSNGLPRQVMGFRRFPVAEGEELEVQELTGARANVEWRLLVRELLGGDAAVQEMAELLGAEGTADVQRGPLRFRRDRHKRVSEVWVRWSGQRSLLGSGPGDRHYVLDRTTGRVRFGDGEQGLVPPLGAAVVAFRYRTGGGRRGNVAAGAISQLLAGIPGVDKVFNPRPAEGGADAETADAVSWRGPRTLHHRGRGLCAGDLETLAREASPAVAVARAIPTLNAAGRPQPGCVTLVVIPDSEEPRPWPSFGLRERVRQAVEARASADIAAAGRIFVTGPQYIAVDVEATISPRDPAEAGPVEKAARAAIESFLHPLRGGPERRGWEMGRGVYLSDLAAVLERVDGLDHVGELALFVEAVRAGEQVDVPESRVVVAGTIRIKVI